MLVGGPIIVITGIQLTTKTPLYTPLNPDLAGSFLATMAQVLAGILAIVFSVSVLAVDIASDRYTPRLFAYFTGSWATLLSFFSILALTILAVIAIGVQAIPMSQWRYLLMTGLFVFCLLTLPFYFHQTLKLLDPRNLAEQIRNEGQRGLKKQAQQQVLDAVTSLGDIAVKAFERGEDEITKKYLSTLCELEQELITSGTALLSSNAGKDVMSALLGFGVRSPIFDQYYRVFKAAIAKRNEEVTLYIVGLLSDGIATLTEQSNSTEFLKGRLQQYQDFAKMAIEDRDISRFSLIHSLREAIFPRSYTNTFTEDYLPILKGAIVQVNKIIIDSRDFELWKRQLGYFSSVVSIDNIYSSLTSNLHELLLRDELLQARRALWEQMELPLRTRITPTNKRAFELGLSQIGQLIPASDQKLREKFLEIRQLFYELGAITGIYDAFFTICVYAFYRKQLEYIKELWRHVNPKDASAHWANTNLIHFDIGFLTYQMYYHVLLPWEIEDYHGSEVYVFRYYLLCLAYTLLHTHSDWYPATPFLFKPLLDRDEEYSEIMREELHTAYAFLMNLPYYADKALTQYDTVASEKEEWEDVFDGKISDALEKARDWLTDTQHRQEWTSKAEGIVRDLPLDNRRVEAYRKSALEYYKEESQIKHLAIQAEIGDKQNAVDLTGRWHYQNPDKQHFTLIGLDEPERIGARVGFGAMRDLVRLEISHIAKILLTQKEQEVINLEGLDFDSVLKTVKRIKQAGYSVTVLIAPSQEISYASQKDHRFRVNVRYENQKERYLQIDTDTKLKIIELPGDYAFIFGKKAGSWATIKPTMIEVKERDKDPLSVEISATEMAIYQMLNPQAVEILKFNKQKEPP